MTSPVLEPVVGLQRPRVASYPESVAGSGREVIELARMAGVTLDPWQEFVIEHSLGERADGRWAAKEVGVHVPRQNGKDEILLVRELGGLYVLDERFLVHSAHMFDTSLEAFRRLLFVIENCDELRRRVKRVSKSHGEEGIELLGGSRIRFRTRTKGGGRGFSGDCTILNEAMDISLAAQGALMPTMSARPNPQVWYAGSAVDQNVHEHGIVFARVRRRGLEGDPELAWFDWSVDVDWDHVHELLDDEEAWAQANPALGIRLSHEFTALERRSMDPRTFAVERLGVGDWPRLEEDEQEGLSIEAWNVLEDPTSTPQDPVRLAFDVTPDRSGAAIGIAGFRADGLRHIEVVEHKSNTNWVAQRVAEIQQRHKTGPAIYDLKSPAAALLPQMVALGVRVDAVGAAEHAAGCGMLFDDVLQGELRHLGTPELAAAIRGAGQRPLGDAWAWSRKNSTVDISPLVAVTLARWGLTEKRPPSTPLVAWR